MDINLLVTGWKKSFHMLFQSQCCLGATAPSYLHLSNVRSSGGGRAGWWSGHGSFSWFALEHRRSWPSLPIEPWHYSDGITDSVPTSTIFHALMNPASFHPAVKPSGLALCHEGTPMGCVRSSPRTNTPTEPKHSPQSITDTTEKSQSWKATVEGIRWRTTIEHNDRDEVSNERDWGLVWKEKREFSLLIEHMLEFSERADSHTMENQKVRIWLKMEGNLIYHHITKTLSCDS